MKHLRAQASLFGSVPSDSRLYRTFRQLSTRHPRWVVGGAAHVRAEVWRRSSATTGTAAVVLDIAASLHQVHSENKEQAAPNDEGG